MAQFSGRINDVDIRLLRVFVSVAEHGGISTASDILGVDRSTISRQVSELETRLGLRLCERSRAGFWLTDEGVVILKRAQELLSAIRDFRQHVSDVHKELEGEFVIAVAETTMWDRQFYLPRVIQGFKKAAPKVTPIVKTLPIDVLTSELESRRSHIAILPVPDRRSNFHYVHLYNERNVLCCGADHPLYSAAAIPSVKDVKEYPTVSVQFESSMGRMINDLGLMRGPMVNTIESLSVMVASGLYLGYLAADYVAYNTVRGRLRPLEIPNTDYSVEIAVAMLDGEQKKAMTSLFLNELAMAYGAT